MTLRTQSDPHALLVAARERIDRAPLKTVLAPRGLGRYRGYGELLEAFERVSSSGARLLTIGRSVRGEPLFAFQLGSAATSARTSVVVSGIHPNEWIGVEAHLGLLERLLAVDLGERSVICVPIANPDGLLRVEDNLRARRRRFVRHNAHGVDLNRNFDAHWHAKGISQRVLSRLFSSGTHPFSEPETEAIARLLAPRRVDRAVSLHSFGGAVLYPPAYARLPVADAAEHRTWANRIARAADPRRPYRTVTGAWFQYGFVSSGLELDWFHDRHGALSLLVECSRGGFGLRPSRLFDPFAWFNPPDIEPVVSQLGGALLPFVCGSAA